jgi:hypothetical protein
MKSQAQNFSWLEQEHTAIYLENNAPYSLKNSDSICKRTSSPTKGTLLIIPKSDRLITASAENPARRNKSSIKLGKSDIEESPEKYDGLGGAFIPGLNEQRLAFFKKIL